MLLRYVGFFWCLDLSIIHLWGSIVTLQSQAGLTTKEKRSVTLIIDQRKPAMESAARDMISNRDHMIYLY